MTLLRCAVFLVLWLGVEHCQAKVFTLQTDFKRNMGNHQIWDLSQASNGKALMMKPHSIISINFCLRTTSDVTIVDFRFTNANKSEVVMVEIDKTLMGIFKTPVTMNNDWNSFLSTGRFPRKLRNMKIGWHNIYVKFNGTADGMGVDKIDLDINDDRLTKDIFTCQLSCIENARFKIKGNEFLTEPSFIVQESYKTTCPEVDNINIPIFNPSVQTYEITASFPQYRSLSNWRHENTTGCPHLSPILWTFNNLQLSPNTHDAVRTEKAIVTFSPGEASYSKFSLTVTVMFQLEGKSSGMVDNNMGSIFKVRFKGLSSDVKISMTYKGKASGMPSPVKRDLTPQHSEATWNIGDFTWLEGYYNFIVMRLETNASLPLHLDAMFLERRPMLADTVITLHKDDNIIVEAIVSDFWWLAPEEMTLSLSTGVSRSNVSYFRIYRPIPWNTGYAQVFVMYQDGNARLLPVPMEGADWVPFGSSVILGQADPTVVRPYASIKEVQLDIENIVMDVSYHDGGFAKLTLESSMSETRVVVSNIRFALSPLAFPFATFRSMYVTEGNADVDHVSVNGKYSYHIMDNFSARPGRSFVFYRKCMSRHLNMSPDIYIDIRRTGNDVAKVHLLQSQDFRMLLDRIQKQRLRLWTPRY